MRKGSLENNQKKQTKNNIPVFALKFDPRLPAITKIQAKHWRTMTQDSYMAEVFPQPPLTAFRRQNIFKDILIKAKVPEEPKHYSQRQKIGMSKCGN